MKSKIIKSVGLWGAGKEFQKRNFIVRSKIAVLLLVSIAFAAIASGQALFSEKQKTALAKDTVKKSKNFLEPKEIDSDTLWVSGKFKLYKKAAHASYYADKFHGRKTASGKKYDKDKLTAAHKKLAFGTKVKVTNEANGKSVIVEITDRGPFVRSREIDLSRRAFMEISKNKSSGSMSVTLEVLQK